MGGADAVYRLELPAQAGKDLLHGRHDLLMPTFRREIVAQFGRGLPIVGLESETG